MVKRIIYKTLALTFEERNALEEALITWIEDCLWDGDEPEQRLIVKSLLKRLQTNRKMYSHTTKYYLRNIPKEVKSVDSSQH